MARIRGLHPASNPSKSTSSGGDPPYRKKGATAVGLQRFWQGLLLAILLVVPCVLVEAQGNIFLTGHAIDGHPDNNSNSDVGHDGYDKIIFDFLSGNNTQNDNGHMYDWPVCDMIPPADYRISLIGTFSSDATTPANWNAHASGYTYMNFYSTVDLANGTGTASDPDWDWVLANTDCLVILSHTTAAGESITDSGVQNIYDNASKIRAAFNGGMDLFVNTGSECSPGGTHGSDPNHGAYYHDFLPPSLITATGHLCGEPDDGHRPTIAGCSINITGPQTIPFPWCSCGSVTSNSMTNNADTYGYFAAWNENVLTVMDTWSTHSAGVGCPSECDVFPNGCDDLWNYNRNTVDFDGVGCGSDDGPDSVVISLAGRCITLCNSSPIDFQCHPDGSPGTYQYTFSVTAGSDDIDAITLDSIEADISPENITTMVSAGTTETFTVSISNVSSAGSSFNVDIDLWNNNNPSCSSSHELDLPNCCVNLTNPMSIECIPLDEGGFDFSAQLTNASGFEIVKMFIPDVVDPSTGDTLIDIEPNVIRGFSPVADGDLLPILDLSFSGVASGQDFLMTVVLMAKDENGLLFECCSRDLGVSLPICCNDLDEDSLDVHCQDADGNFPFDFRFLNWGHMAPSEAAHAFLLPISPAGVTFEPDYFDLTQMGSQPTVSDGSYSDLLNTMIQGAGLGQEITFELIIHNEDMSECCNQVHTIITSDCTAGGGGGGNASSEASFLRGDANTDGSFDIADVILSLGYLFQDLPVSCLLALDSNDDQTVDIGDSIYSLNALFGGGPSPGPPHQQCGDDTSAGTLDCDSFPLCDTANNDPQGG